MDLVTALRALADRRSLSESDMAAVIGAIMDGAATPAQIGGLLLALRMKGETVDELVGAARAMRQRVHAVALPDGIVVDTCGTGGDGRGTINVSTLGALVAAAAGARVAKHGNRAVSSRAGSADLLEALGVVIASPPEVAARCLDEIGFGFFFAPTFHGATRHVAAVRRELGVRTIFNLLGPLTNPAGARHQVIGVFDAAWVEPVAEALLRLGSERALVVHGDGGLDEIAPHGPTQVVELQGGRLTRRQLTPDDFGLPPAPLSSIDGGDAADNARRARLILGGQPDPARTAVLLAAAAALYVAGEPDLRRAAERAGTALDRGDALRLIEQLALRSAG